MFQLQIYNDGNMSTTTIPLTKMISPNQALEFIYNNMNCDELGIDLEEDQFESTEKGMFKIESNGIVVSLSELEFFDEQFE